MHPARLLDLQLRVAALQAKQPSIRLVCQLLGMLLYFWRQEGVMLGKDMDQR